MSLTPFRSQLSEFQYHIDPDVDDEKPNVDDKKQGPDFVSLSKQSNVQKPAEPQQESTKTNSVVGEALLKLETAWDKYVSNLNSAATESDNPTPVVVPFDDVQKAYIQTKAICEKLIAAIESSRDRAGLCWTVGWTVACLDPDQRKNKADLRFRLNTLDNIHETISFIEEAAEELIDLEISPAHRFHAENPRYYRNLHKTLLSTGEALSSFLRRIEDCNLALKALGSSKIAQITSSQAQDVDKSLGFDFKDTGDIASKFSKEMPWVDELLGPDTFPESAGKAIKYYCSLLISVRGFLDKYKYQLGDLNSSQALIYFQTYQTTFEIEKSLLDTANRIKGGSFSPEDMNSSDNVDAYNLTIKHMVATLAKNLPEPTNKWNTEKDFTEFLTTESKAGIKSLHLKLDKADKNQANLRFLQQVLVYADLQINNLSKIAPEKSELVKQMRFDLRRATRGLINGNSIFYINTKVPIDIRQVINLGLRANAAREEILQKRQKAQQVNVALPQSVTSLIDYAAL
jgi:hypothetical protein